MHGLSRTWQFLAGIVIVYLAPAGFGLVLGATAGEQPADERTRLVLAVFAFLAMMIYPVAAMVVGFFSGLREPKAWAVPLIAAVLSIPFTLWHLTAAAWVGSLIYTAVYLVFGYVGWFLGSRVHARRQAAADAAA